MLGPVDPQLSQSPASIVKVLERNPIREIDDQTIIQAGVAEKALRQVEGGARGGRAGRPERASQPRSTDGQQLRG